MKILVINGPNINMLGIREPDIYGSQNYEALLAYIRGSAAEVGVDVDCFQSNHEGAIVDVIQDALGKYDGIVINPAAYTHTSAVEVHISDVDAREPFRQISYAGMACAQKYAGYGFEGYKLAILWLKENVNN